jgi:protein transport protein SEC13
MLPCFFITNAPPETDRTVKIYDVNGNSYTHTATLQGHTGPVWSVAWSHPKFGIVLASCSFDGSVLIHRETRPREWTLLHHARNLHDSSVNSVGFCPHEFGLVIAAASSDGKVSILTHGGQDGNDSWNVEYITDNTMGVNAVSFAPYTAYMKSENAAANSASPAENSAGALDAPTSNSTSNMHLVTGGCDNRIKFWNKSNISNKWELDSSPISSEVTHSDWVRDVAWAPSVVPNTNVVASCSEDRTVIIWTQVGGAGKAWEPKLLQKFDDPVWRVSWSVTGSILAVSSGDNSVTLWKQTLEGDWIQVSSVQEADNGQQQG